MTIAPLVLPRPETLDWVSPTQANALLECAYRLVLVRVGAVERRPTPFTAVGLTAHRLHEVVASGAFADVPDGERRAVLQSAWDEQIACWHEKMRAAWAPTEPPDPSVWPGIDLTRSRVVRALLRGDSWGAPAASSIGQAAPSGSASAHGLPPLPQTELKLEDAPRRLFGTLDRLHEDERGLVVTDVKTGVLQGDASEEQRRQLLIYADLVQAVSGRLPGALVILDAGGREHPIPFNPGDVEAAVNEVDEARSQLNHQIDAGADLHLLAQPDSQRCSRCSQAAACLPYWLSLKSDWGHGSAMGPVEAIASGPSGLTVTLRLASPVDAAGSIATLTGVTAPPEVGEEVVATGFETTSSALVLRGRWDSRVASWRREPSA